MRKKKPEIKSLYYITHVDNIPSILKYGILSHQSIEERSIPFTPIYDASIVSSRKSKLTPDRKSLWAYANLYFQPRNPMLYRVLHQKDEGDIAILGLEPAVMETPGLFISTGNAASVESDILTGGEGLKEIGAMWNTISAEWWNSLNGSKRKIMAECLIPAIVPPDRIHTVYVANREAAQKVRDMRPPKRISVVPEPNMFFLPTKRHRLNDHLFLIEGDMFFSKLQTLTVSVNTVGVMGKGLASRAKYQFPDVYVAYQDACRSKALRMGEPYLYKRESFVDEELADEPATLPGPNAKKWFLLFATKRHWRDIADLPGIEAGLVWIAENYWRERITSLAMPALGCGLGKLDWRDVGPVICRHLAALTIDVAVYLPREHEIPQDLLSPSFLLGAQS